MKKIVKDNPDLSKEFIEEILLAAEEVKLGLTTKYVRTTKKETSD